ncbi:baculoviral IAP repeat-containing protein 5-like [Cryptotermes secundus]|uniref:baculoviral IAP repeat-containing protein 5-like n=1 Tax=Cryptotermes secundus TaxID=105785 RepID=UPI000CD7AD9C|nr:baculoviral IAP repeat-containing protein 5-like [Cryptotermes secundus]XP_023723910.1 baculoviral IAP repeat-containing protein 5-like [Cryptotermes secundus]XP_023723911.1 baculoviral IAP repeat-containing protein 5-like [Cryptotermes secundus]
MEVLAQYKNMKDYMFQDQRLETFSEWPFDEDSSCNAHKMAEAGFIFCGSKSEPDLAQCQVCLKKLDGWEQDDEPWKEHKKHSPSCLYVKIGKKEADMTVGNYFDLPLERRRNIMKEEYETYRASFIEMAAEVRKKITKLRKLKK